MTVSKAIPSMLLTTPSQLDREVGRKVSIRRAATTSGLAGELSSEDLV